MSCGWEYLGISWHYIRPTSKYIIVKILAFCRPIHVPYLYDISCDWEKFGKIHQDFFTNPWGLLQPLSEQHGKQT